MVQIGYIVQSREAVYKALVELNQWSTHLEVRDYGRKHIEAPESESRKEAHFTHPRFSHSTSGWKVWDFNNRVKRALETLCKQKKVIKKDNKFFDEFR